MFSWNVLGVPYQLDQLVELSRQPKLSAFFPLKSNSSTEVAEVPSNHHVKLENEQSLSYEVTYKDKPLSEVGEITQNRTECSGESVFSGHGTPFDVIKEEPNSVDVDENCSEVKTTASSPSDVEDERNAKKTIESSPLRSSASDSRHCLDNQNSKESELIITGDHNQRHSTLGDPNFVKNYFKVIVYE